MVGISLPAESFGIFHSWCMFEELSAFWHFYSPPDYFRSITALLDADWLSLNEISPKWMWLSNAHPSCSGVKLKWCLWVASWGIAAMKISLQIPTFVYPHLYWRSLEDKARIFSGPFASIKARVASFTACVTKCFDCDLVMSCIMFKKSHEKTWSVDFD